MSAEAWELIMYQPHYLYKKRKKGKLLDQNMKTFRKEIMHGIVVCFDELWFVVERQDGFWDIRKKGVSITYFEQCFDFDEFVRFLRIEERRVMENV